MKKITVINIYYQSYYYRRIHWWAGLLRRRHAANTNPTYYAANTNPAWHTANTNPAWTEVREYQGENLSSINDFRENSIKGPQYH